MARVNITITVDEHALAEIDQLVADGVFPNRSKAFETAVQDRIAKLHRSRLALECSKLDRAEERPWGRGVRWGKRIARILRSDILWAELNPVVGHEQAGQRPVVV